jgi:hypothetical protein
MVTWTIFKNNLLELGPTQHWETMAFKTLTIIGWFYFIIFPDPREKKIIEIFSIWLKA